MNFDLAVQAFATYPFPVVGAKLVHWICFDSVVLQWNRDAIVATFLSKKKKIMKKNN